MTEPATGWIDGLLWAVAELERLGIPHQLVGGAPASLYGVDRPVHDVDFYVPAADLPKLVEAQAHRLIRPPQHHRDEHWDLTFLALEYRGVRVEIAAADAAYRERHTSLWHDAAIDFADATPVRVRGRMVQVMPVQRLREYKRRLDRPVDRMDCAALEGHAS